MFKENGGSNITQAQRNKDYFDVFAYAYVELFHGETMSFVNWPLVPALLLVSLLKIMFAKFYSKYITLEL